MTDLSRRAFARRLVAGTGAICLAPAAMISACRSVARAANGESGVAVDGWSEVPAILARIAPPRFPARDFNVTRFGARGDGTTDCTDAFRQAIAACHDAGGGRVLVPSGRFLTGPIHLRSGVNLHVTGGAIIAFVQDPKRYLPAVLTRWEGTELMNYSPFIYAFEQENVAITGTGTLDGQADESHWWPWNGRPQYGWKQGAPDQKAARTRLMQMAEQGVSVSERTFGEGDLLRPQFIQPYRCRNVLIEGVTIVRSPMWEIHPVLCTNVIVRNVKIRSHGPNNDGCDPESCTDVLIEGCEFDTGDDCIAIKSGRNADGRRLNVPSRNILVRNCTMKDGHGGVTIGSEISGGVHHVFVEHCRMDSPNLERALRLKTNAMRGGVLEHIYMRNVTVGQVTDAVLSIDFTYEEGATGPFSPVVRNIVMQHVTSQRSMYAVYLKGFASAPITFVTLEDCTFANVAKPDVTEQVHDLVFRRVTVNGRRVGE